MANPVPETMNAIEIAEFGGPDVLKPAKRPVPKPGPGEVLIEVAAAGINRPDMLQRQGGYRPPPGASDIPGLEIAGRIVALGPDVSGWQIGDQACALVAGGGYAEFCTAPAPQCLPFPRGMDAIKAAAVPETFFTVWTNVFDRGRLKAGETFLVHGGSSGIGTTAIQLAHAIRRPGLHHRRQSPKNARPASSWAPSGPSITSARISSPSCRRQRQQKGVDVILDMVGGPYINRNLQILAMEGRLVQIAFLQGQQVRDRSGRADDEAPDADRLDLRPALRRRERRHRPIAAREGLAAARHRQGSARSCSRPFRWLRRRLPTV